MYPPEVLREIDFMTKELEKIKKRHGEDSFIYRIALAGARSRLLELTPIKKDDKEAP
ncbi:hypothetical protein PM3016_5413 [Paenibacillus mucilaginosus 3016]|uniref:Uncharacterized protein n=1 Tax=Paenibacillus mucilaginosus 3016 TaxID=1116391 RepID=H6NDR4_9BACL|nr:hypothetical protein [Paenibacillus mucilaginosus]AFC32113.1 hypothetical protein PM3016_5413 [Paenibacillus mucilaginosus 3016]